MMHTYYVAFVRGNRVITRWRRRKSAKPVGLKHRMRTRRLRREVFGAPVPWIKPRPTTPTRGSD